MANSDLAAVFADTRNLYGTNEKLRTACESSRKTHKVYEEGCSFSSDRNRFDEDAKVVVSKKRSFEAAEQYAKQGLKTCVLNFANSVHPGGGVVRGARAQEECLCRCSTLYDSLSSDEMKKAFYQPHFKKGYTLTDDDMLANDDAILTPGVVVFKSDTNSPALRPENEWFSVDVVTCAAPCLRTFASSVSDEELFKIHESRARQIMSVALEAKADALILGAFGCGAFCNPPSVVAKVYKSVLDEFKHSFKVVEFAVYCSPRELENFDEFDSVFK